MNDQTGNTYLLMRALCDELARGNVAGVCTSPGSRSVPIVLSCLAEPTLRCYSHIDERVAAFFALGLARQSGAPAVLVCTSGTAAANYLPAIIEAREAGLPLIVLTADRPPELRRVGAGQAIDQIKMFGSNVAMFEEIDGSGPASAQRLRWLRQLTCRALHVARTDGPVHLNIALREPLILDRDDETEGGGGRPDGLPWTAAPVPPATADSALDLLPGDAACGLIVAGSGDYSAAAAARLAAARGWPLLADPQSGARCGPMAIAHYDLILRSTEFSGEGAPQPDFVLRLGALPTSKPLRRWLSNLTCEQVHARAEPGWQDPDAVCTQIVPLGTGALIAASGRAVGLRREPAWSERWRSADAAAAAAIAGAAGDELNEPNIARTLAGTLPDRATVVIASSMPIRDAESFWPLRKKPLPVHANRGANGIDGTIATAYGVAAAAAGRPTYLLIGDVAFAHDASALLSGSRLKLNLTVVLVDNGGGGIFDLLPVAAAASHDDYERHIATPPAIAFADLADAYGARYLPLTTLADLERALSCPPVAGTTILHLRVDRTQAVALRRELERAVIAAIKAQ